MDVSVVIPVYNTKEIVENTVDQIIHFFKPLNLNYEILLCDDGSTDGVQSILRKIEKQYSCVKCFYNTQNKGLGATLQALFVRSRGEHVIYCDCDLPFGVDVIASLMTELRSCDIAVASRYMGEQNRIHWIRKICSRLYYLLCRFLFNIPIVDIGSGSVGITHQALSQINLKARGFGIHVELYINALNQGLVIKEFSAQSVSCVQSSFSIWKHGPQIIIETIRLRLQRFHSAV